MQLRGHSPWEKTGKHLNHSMTACLDALEAQRGTEDSWSFDCAVLASRALSWLAGAHVCDLEFQVLRCGIESGWANVVKSFASQGDVDERGAQGFPTWGRSNTSHCVSWLLLGPFSIAVAFDKC